MRVRLRMMSPRSSKKILHLNNDAKVVSKTLQSSVQDVSEEEKSIGINIHCCTPFDMPVSPLHGDAEMWGRLPANDDMRVSPLAVLAVLTNVMVM